MKTNENTNANTPATLESLKARLTAKLANAVDIAENASEKQALTMYEAMNYSMSLTTLADVSVNDIMTVKDNATAFGNAIALGKIIEAGEKITNAVKRRYDFARAKALANVKSYPVIIIDKETGTVAEYETFTDYWKALKLPNKQRASEFLAVGAFFMSYIPEYTAEAPISRYLKFMQIVPKLDDIDKEFWNIWNKGFEDKAIEYARNELKELDIKPTTKEGGLRKDILKKQEKPVKPESKPESKPENNTENTPENAPENAPENTPENTPELVEARPYIDDIYTIDTEDIPVIRIEFNSDTPNDIINKVLETIKDVYGVK